ncbi:MAG: hypothetical protein ISR99_01895 [Parcubacteria group bacterium]|nr:hypothetical protein [Parcubacteria group bacterium]
MNYAIRSIIILGAVGLFAIGYFLFTNGTDTPLKDDSDTATTTDKVADVKSDTVSDTKVIKEDTQVDTDLDPNSITFTSYVEDRSVPQPDIDRETVFATALVELKELTAEGFKKTRENLHEEPYSMNDWLDLAIHYKTVDDFDGAKEVWEYLTLAAPNNSVPFNNLGDLYHFYLHDFPKAEGYMKDAIKRANDPSYFLNLYQLYKLSYKKDTNLAELALLDGLKSNQGNINILMALAKHYEDLGEGAKAITRYKEAKQHAQLVGDIPLVGVIDQAIARVEK